MLIYCITYRYFEFLLFIPYPTIMNVPRMHMNMKIANVWDAMLCGMAEMYQYRTIKYCLHLQGRR
jgi:hypothetical protein